MNILDSLAESLYHTIATIFNTETKNTVELTLNTEEAKQAFGDLSTNAALVYAKQLGKNPREIAQIIIENFNHPAIQKMEIAGPGFINIFLTQTAFSELAQAAFSNPEQFFKPLIKEHHNYNVEFVSANPTGPLHIGHGRGGIIGDVLANVLRFVGQDVTKEFYINDAGTQIAKLGASFKARCLQQLGQEAVFPEDGYHGEYLSHLAQLCIETYGTALLEKNDQFFDEYAKEYLLSEIKITLQEYGIHFDVWFSEKSLHHSGSIDKALEKLATRGYLYESEGALWFRSTDFGDDKDRVVKKQSGELTYVAADVAYLENKLSRGADQLIMILGQDHHSYVARLKAVMQALGYDPDRLTVILYQLVTLKESGEYLRLSKRAGRIISLKDIIQEVGCDVARFFYLNRKADAHLEFDLDLAIKQSDENPVYYIQYAYVRTISMMDKAAQLEELSPISAEHLVNFDASDKLLLKKIITLRSYLKTISEQYQTHLLTYYVLDLAHAFHKYYAQNRVIDPNDVITSKRRLALVKLINLTLKLGLDLLGLSAPQKM